MIPFASVITHATDSASISSTRRRRSCATAADSRCTIVAPRRQLLEHHLQFFDHLVDLGERLLQQRRPGVLVLRSDAEQTLHRGIQFGDAGERKAFGVHSQVFMPVRIRGLERAAKTIAVATRSPAVFG